MANNNDFGNFDNNFNQGRRYRPEQNHRAKRNRQEERDPPQVARLKREVEAKNTIIDSMQQEKESFEQQMYDRDEVIADLERQLDQRDRNESGLKMSSTSM